MAEFVYAYSSGNRVRRPDRGRQGCARLAAACLLALASTLVPSTATVICPTCKNFNACASSNTRTKVSANNAWYQLPAVNTQGLVRITPAKQYRMQLHVTTNG